MPRPEGAGRKAGTPNKKTQKLHEIADQLGVSPFEVLLLVVKADWKALGYSTATISRVLKDGSVFEEERISLETRLAAAKETAKYLYPQRKAVELSTDEDKGFRIVVEEYVRKEK